jgi:hypothetical protein
MPFFCIHAVFFLQSVNVCIYQHTHNTLDIDWFEHCTSMVRNATEKKSQKSAITKSRTIPKRSRNKAADKDTQNKWITYKKKINRLLLRIKRDEHYCYVLSMQKHSNDIIQLGEWQRFEENIRRSKVQIIETLEQLQAENSADIKHSSLSANTDDGMIDVMGVDCSRCGKSDEDGNDILFCDRKGCNRAYHENCCDPPLQKGIMDLEDPDEDWFCWQCECIDDCFDMIADMCDIRAGITSIAEVFSELQHDMAEGQCDDYDEDDSEDEDFSDASSCGDDGNGADSEIGGSADGGSGGDDSSCDSRDSEEYVASGDEVTPMPSSCYGVVGNMFLCRPRCWWPMRFLTV